MGWPGMSYDAYGVPFGWTLVSIVITWGIGLPIFSTNMTSLAAQICVSVLFALQGLYFSVFVIVYLFGYVMNTRKRSTAVGSVLGLIDVWMALLTSQAGALYITYIFWPTTGFFGLTPGNGPWFVFLQFLYTMANNFHGSTSAGIFPLTAYPYVILFICSILSRLFLIFTVPIVFKALSPVNKRIIKY
jgi:hypothetical protein